MKRISFKYVVVIFLTLIMATTYISLRYINRQYLSPERKAASQEITDDFIDVRNNILDGWMSIEERKIITYLGSYEDFEKPDVIYSYETTNEVNEEAQATVELSGEELLVHYGDAGIVAALDTNYLLNGIRKLTDDEVEKVAITIFDKEVMFDFNEGIISEVDEPGEGTHHFGKIDFSVSTRYFTALYIVLAGLYIFWIVDRFVNPISKISDYIKGKVSREEYLGADYDKEFNRLFESIHTYIEKSKDKIAATKMLKSDIESVLDKIGQRNNELYDKLVEVAKANEEMDAVASEYMEICDNLEHSILQFDEDGVITYVNSRFKEEFGYTSKEVRGTNIHDYIAHDDGILNSVIMGGNAVSTGISIVNASGGRKFQSARISRIEGLYNITFIPESAEKRSIIHAEKRNMQLKLINEIDLDKISRGTEEDYYKTIAYVLSKLFPLEYMTIRKIEETSAILVYEYGKVSMHRGETVINIEGSLFEKVVSNGKSVFIEEHNEVFGKNYYASEQLSSGKIIAYLPVLAFDEAKLIIGLISENILSDDLKETIETINRKLSIAYETLKTADKMKNRVKKTSYAILDMIEKNIGGAEGHNRRVLELARMMGNSYFLSTEELEKLETAALLHDVGMVGLKGETDYSKNKSREDHGNHASMGYDIFKEIGMDEEILHAIKYHHFDAEKENLRIDKLPVITRLIAFADEVDFIALKGKPGSLHELLELLMGQANIRVSTSDVNVFRRLIKKSPEVLSELLNLEIGGEQ